MILLAITARPEAPPTVGGGPPSYVEARCPAGHDVHVYYERCYPEPPDGSA